MSQTRPKPLIAILGLAIETSTFSPARTATAAFHILRGEAILSEDPNNAFLSNSNSDLRAAVNWQPILTAHALPGGVVTRKAFETLTAVILSGLEQVLSEEQSQHGDSARGIEGLWFEIHGAMVVEGIVDAEAGLLQAVRGVIGNQCLVSASMDLHGNVSRELIQMCDLCTAYRTAPHVDVAETRERAVRGLLALVEGRRKAEDDDDDERKGSKWRRPFKAWIPIPVLLPGEQTSTRLQPAKRIYEAVPAVESEEGVIDAAIWVGYAWADEPRCHAVVVVTGWDEAAVAQGAEKLARMFWEAHREFRFVAPTGSFEECLDAAFASRERPYFVSDSGDNPTAGGAGDVTWGLTELLKRKEVQDVDGPKVVYASIPGADAVAKAVEAGVGAFVSVTAGAEVDDLHAGPISLSGRVHSIFHGDRHAETEVVIQVGSVFAIVTKKRKPYHKERDFLNLKIDIRGGGFDVVVVKIGYLEPELFDMAKDWMLALTPGGVDQDLVRLGHKTIWRPMWPFDREFKAKPDLRARMIPAVGA